MQDTLQFWVICRRGQWWQLSLEDWWWSTSSWSSTFATLLFTFKVSMLVDSKSKWENSSRRSTEKSDISEWLAINEKRLLGRIHRLNFQMIPGKARVDGQPTRVTSRVSGRSSYKALGCNNTFASWSWEYTSLDADIISLGLHVRYLCSCDTVSLIQPFLGISETWFKGTLCPSRHGVLRITRQVIIPDEVFLSNHDRKR